MNGVHPTAKKLDLKVVPLPFFLFKLGNQSLKTASVIVFENPQKSRKKSSFFQLT